MNQSPRAETWISQCLHKGPVAPTDHRMPPTEKLNELAGLFKLFGDLTRLRILSALFDKELCVCELAERLQMEQSAVSHQLRLLRTGKLVACRREGKSVYYMLDDDHVRLIFDQGYVHINEKRSR